MRFLQSVKGSTSIAHGETGAVTRARQSEVVHGSGRTGHALTSSTLEAVAAFAQTSMDITKPLRRALATSFTSAGVD